MDPEKLSEKRRLLEAQLEELRQQEEHAYQERAAIVGRVVLAFADENEEFRARLNQLLDERLTGTPERRLFGLEKRTKRGRRPKQAEPAGQA